MQGSDVRRAREALGWNRPELAAATGYGFGEAGAISAGRISRIESGSAISPEEESTLRRILGERLADAPITGAPPGVGQPAPETAVVTGIPISDCPHLTNTDLEKGRTCKVCDQSPAVDDFDTGVVISSEWCGLEPGTVVKLQGDPKPNRRYSFIHHVKKPSQEYVELKGIGRATGRTVNPHVTTLLMQVKGKWTEVKP